MRIQPVASPAAIPPNGTPESVRTAKAVEAFNKGASSYDKPMNHSAQLDQNNISPEDISAIRQQPSNQTNSGQSSTNEEVQTAGITEETRIPQAEIALELKKPEVDPAVSRQFAQLARQTKAIRAEQLKLQAEREQLAKDREALQSQPKEDLSQYIPKSRLKEDFLTAAQEAGLTYDEITQAYMNQPQRNPLLEAQLSKQAARMAELEAKLEAQEKTQIDNQTAQYQAAVKQIEMDAKTLVNSDPEFETIKASGAVRSVVKLITDTYNKDKVLLTVEEAAKLVEDQLVENAMKYTKLNKIQKRLQSSVASAATPGQQTQAPVKQTQTMKTLTNQTSSTRKLSARERALLAFKGELKS